MLKLVHVQTGVIKKQLNPRFPDKIELPFFKLNELLLENSNPSFDLGALIYQFVVFLGSCLCMRFYVNTHYTTSSRGEGDG